MFIGHSTSVVKDKIQSLKMENINAIKFFNQLDVLKNELINLGTLPHLKSGISSEEIFIKISMEKLLSNSN